MCGREPMVMYVCAQTPVRALPHPVRQCPLSPTQCPATVSP